MKSHFLSSLIALLLLSPCLAFSQVGVNRSVEVSQVDELVLPALIDDMFFLDGKLHFSSDGMLFTVSNKNGKLGDLEVDTAMLAVNPEMTYAVRHQSSGSLYFTKRTPKGVSELYEYYQKKPGKYSVRHIRPARFSFSIEHPVFTSDGQTMVFVSDCPLGFGGLDLWYSQLNNGEWQYPQNMGHRINTEVDEKSPVLYGDFLIYATNGKPAGRGGFDLFAARLVAMEQNGDTVMMYPIGRCPAFSMELPFCSIENDVAMVFSSDMSYGWWQVRHEALNTNDQSSDILYSFSGMLNSVKLSGRVTDKSGEPIPQALLRYAGNDASPQMVRCDNEGQFTVFLQANRKYDVTFSAKNYFSSTVSLSPVRFNEERLYSTQIFDVMLDSYELDKPYSFGDIFNSSVTSELSAAGRAHVDSLALFLTQNPHLKISVVSSFNMSEDMPFCSLLNQSRLRSITERLMEKGVPAKSILASVGEASAMPRQMPSDDNELPEVTSSKTVVFSFKR